MQHEPNQTERLNFFLTVSTALFGLAVGSCLSPPVFVSVFSMGTLVDQDVLGLWSLSTVIVFLSGFCYFSKKFKFSTVNFTLLFVSMLILIVAELGARAYIVLFKPDSAIRMAHLANRTYPGLMAYQGHPFLQFTGRPSISLVGNQSLGDLSPFNNFGFIGDDFSYQKSTGIVRIAALGGSTTARGYPKMLETYLNNTTSDSTVSFEVLNFGLGWYTSIHSLVNFVTNVTDFSPDYVIIHHAWNDGIARNAGKDFRSDYSHALQHFREPVILDRYLIRMSVIYRYAKNKITAEPDWLFLEKALEKPRVVTNNRFRDKDELKPYRRNITSILDLAMDRDTKVILTTQPFSVDPKKLYVEMTPHIEQCNTIMRRIHANSTSEALFVDLDQMMTGRMEEVFQDVAHMTLAGRRFKAEQIGRVILEDRKR